MNSEDAHISEIGITFRRQFRAIILTAGPVFALVVGIALGLPNVYRSTGVIRIDQDVKNERRALDTYAEYYVETLTAQVFSPTNLDSWISKFGIYENEKSWSDERKQTELGKDLETQIVTTPVIDPYSGREREVVTGFEVIFDSATPELAHKVATAAVNAFLEENRRSRVARGQEEIDFYKKESDRYRGQIAEVEGRLADFKEQNARSMPDVKQANMSAMDRVERDLESAQLQIDNLKRERVILKSQLSQIPSTSDEAIKQLADLQNEYVRLSSIYQDTHPAVVSVRKQIDLLSKSVDSSAAIPILQEEQDQITAELAEAREKYSDDHPKVKQLLRSEAAIKDRIAALAKRSDSGEKEVGSTNDLYVQLDTQLKAIDAELSGWNSRVTDLRGKVQEYEKLLFQTPQVERKYEDLQRDLANARDLYEETQKKQRDAELALALTRGTQGEQLVLAQAPDFPEAPSWPPRAAIIVLGLILAAGAGVGVATLRETSSSTIKSARDVFEFCGTPPIALVPTIYNRERRIRQKFQAVSFFVVLGVVVTVAFIGAGGL